MPMLDKRTIDNPNETRPFVAHGRLDVFDVGGFQIGRGVFEPGWKWSVDVKPIAGTESCMTRHTGVCVSGSMMVRADDGTELLISPGDVVVLEPGHDAWTVGDEACVLLDTGGRPTPCAPDLIGTPCRADRASAVVSGHGLGSVLG